MIPWWWTIVALLVGEIVGIIVVAICSANERGREYHQSKYIR